MQNEHIVSDLVFKQLQLETENQSCFDCSQPNPQWASVNNGIFICMNCASLHKSMGTHISFTRSLSMDPWSEFQLRLMALGGNKKHKEFFQKYDLNDENVMNRYQTKASQFYRRQLRCASEMIPASEDQPTYEVGREQMSPDEAKESDSNPVADSGDQMGGMENDHDIFTQSLTQGLALVNKVGDTVADGVLYGADLAKKKADEAGVTEKLTGTGDVVASNLTWFGSKATSLAKDTASSVTTSYADGTLADKT